MPPSEDPREKLPLFYAALSASVHAAATRFAEKSKALGAFYPDIGTRFQKNQINLGYELDGDTIILKVYHPEEARTTPPVSVTLHPIPSESLMTKPQKRSPTNDSFECITATVESDPPFDISLTFKIILNPAGHGILRNLLDPRAPHPAPSKEGTSKRVRLEQLQAVVQADMSFQNILEGVIKQANKTLDEYKRQAELLQKVTEATIIEATFTPQTQRQGLTNITYTLPKESTGVTSIRVQLLGGKATGVPDSVTLHVSQRNTDGQLVETQVSSPIGDVYGPIQIQPFYLNMISIISRFFRTDPTQQVDAKQILTPPPANISDRSFGGEVPTSPAPSDSVIKIRQLAQEIPNQVKVTPTKPDSATERDFNGFLSDLGGTVSRAGPGEFDALKELITVALGIGTDAHPSRAMSIRQAIIDALNPGYKMPPTGTPESVENSQVRTLRSAQRTLRSAQEGLQPSAVRGR